MGQSVVGRAWGPRKSKAMGQKKTEAVEQSALGVEVQLDKAPDFALAAFQGARETLVAGVWASE